MAKMIDGKPDFKGEAKVWEALKTYLPDNVIVYNNREISGREFDYCLLIENYGLLIIEVKGWLADKIEVLGTDNIKVEGYLKPQHSPKKQARSYRFALLNRISELYNISPIVLDMVCYPFISEEEYLKSNLNIVSEKTFTIFKEDLEKEHRLEEKIRAAYKTMETVPHTDFTCDYLSKIRKEWEPEFEKNNIEREAETKPYSVLSIFPDAISPEQILKITGEYFSGIKRIMFLGEEKSYKDLIEAIDNQFESYNLEPSANNISIGYRKGLKTDKNICKTFNLEVYLVPDLKQLTYSEVGIEEGVLDKRSLDILENLSEHTSFNLQQYQVEHASTEKNTLVEAGAGTGKTFSMVSRVAFLCNKKTDPILNIAEEIAMVTFTNDAADNMRRRIKQMFTNYFILTGDTIFAKFIEDIEKAYISTIHSFSIDILREKSLHTGLGNNFRITSDEYLRGKIYDKYFGDFLEHMEEDDGNFIHQVPVPLYELKKKLLGISDRLFAKSIDVEKIKLSEMGQTVENTLPYFNKLLIEAAFPAELEYLETEHLKNNIDLKECIILLNKLLDDTKGKIDILKMKYLFIDEFQDTDDVQIQLFQKLQKHINADCRLFIVGDLKQSIYRFRGATLSAFQEIKQRSLFDWETYHLNINYRTDSRLLEKFDTIFEKMGSHKYLPYVKEKDGLISRLIKDSEEDNLFVELPCHGKDEKSFFETIIKAIKEQKEILEDSINKNPERSLNKEEKIIAVLVRNNWQVEKLVNEAKKSGMFIETKSGGDLFQIEPTLDFYKLVLALNNCYNPVYLTNLAESNYIGLNLDYRKYAGLTVKERTEDMIRIFDEFFTVRMGKSWQELVNETYTRPVLYVVKNIYDSLAPWKQYSLDVNQQTYYMINYEYLMEKILRFFRMNPPTLNQLTEYLKINILTGQKQMSRESGIEDNGIHILCTTIHKSKGLEYGTVILPYTYEDISDIRKAKLDANYSDGKLSYNVQFENKVREYNTNYSAEVESHEQICEESRILYVALTRAIRSCVWINNLDSNSDISWGSLLEE